MDMLHRLQVFTVGHSNLSREKFFDLLGNAGITAIADVRSVPYSKFTPQFNQSELTAALRDVGVAYVFLGNQLGGRPDKGSLFTDGVADYEKMAREVAFREGLERIVHGAERHRIALMCSEQDPLDCHRCLLVGRQLTEKGIDVVHLLGDGLVESHSKIEDRLLSVANLYKEDFFRPRSERLKVAYNERSKRIAFAEMEQDRINIVAKAQQ